MFGSMQDMVLRFKGCLSNNGIHRSVDVVALGFWTESIAMCVVRIKWYELGKKRKARKAFKQFNRDFVPAPVKTKLIFDDKYFRIRGI